MVNPFPGMNPYLENPRWWRSIHARLIAVIDEKLNQALPPAFVSTIEERVYLALPDLGISPNVAPDVFILKSPTAPSNGVGTDTAVADAPFSITFFDEEVTEGYIEIRMAGAEDRIVAVIEVLSPTNKTREAYGQDAYLKKRRQILASDTHFIEIDLLRDGVHTVAAPRELITARAGESWRYVVCRHRAGAGSVFDVWAVPLASRLPVISIPLTAEYPDVTLDLQACLNDVYEAGAFVRRIDYRKEPVPPLLLEDAAWADSLLREQGLRGSETPSVGEGSQ